MNELSKLNDPSDYSIDLRVTGGGNLGTAFTELKNFQNLGLTGKDSNITFNGVTLPAGVFEQAEINICVEVFCAVIAGDEERAIKVIPDTMDPLYYKLLLDAISREMKKNFGVPIEEERLHSLVNDRYESFIEKEKSGRTM